MERFDLMIKDCEIRLKDCKKNLNRTMDNKVAGYLIIEFNYLKSLIRLYKKYDKLLKKYEEGLK